MVSTATSSNSTLGTLSTRDSYIPLFSGQHSDYKEWRKRIKIYMMRMNMTKRGHDAILNLVGSMTGVAWKVAEAYDLEDLDRRSRLMITSTSFSSFLMLPSSMTAG